MPNVDALSESIQSTVTGYLDAKNDTTIACTVSVCASKTKSLPAIESRMCSECVTRLEEKVEMLGKLLGQYKHSVSQYADVMFEQQEQIRTLKAEKAALMQQVEGLRGTLNAQ